MTDDNLDELYYFLERIHTYMDKRQDIKDGPDGEQLPNEEMKLMTECAEFMGMLETQS